MSRKNHFVALSYVSINNNVGTFLSCKSQQNGLLFLAKGFKEIRRSKAAKINDAYASPSGSFSGWQEHERRTLVGLLSI